MRILYLQQDFPVSQGRGRRAPEMARRLVDLGHEVNVIAADSSREGGHWVTAEQNGVMVHRLPLHRSRRMGANERALGSANFAGEAGARMLEVGGDVIYASSTPLSVAKPAAFAAERGGIPMVFEVRELWPELPIATQRLRAPAGIAAARRLEQFAYEHASTVVVASPGAKAQVERRCINPEKVVLIPSGCLPMEGGDQVEQRRLRQQFDSADAGLLFYGGSAGSRHARRYAREVAQAVRDASGLVTLFPAAVALDFDESMQGAAVARPVLAVPNVQRPAALEAAMMTLFVERDVEALSSTLVERVSEALSLGTPLAVRGGDWLARLVEARDCGVVLDDDVQAAAEELLARCRDRAWLEAAGQRAKEAAAELFCWDRAAHSLERVLAKAAGREPAANLEDSPWTSERRAS